MECGVLKKKYLFKFLSVGKVIRSLETESFKNGDYKCPITFKQWQDSHILLSHNIGNRGIVCRLKKSMMKWKMAEI